MLRAIITAVLLTVVAVHLGAPAEDAMGYSIIAAASVWYLWPVLRRLPRAGRGARRRLTTPPGPVRPTRSAQAAPAHQPPGMPALTQINHHHHYYLDAQQQPQWPAGGQPRTGLLGLPRKGNQQITHDIVFTAVDPDSNG